MKFSFLAALLCGCVAQSVVGQVSPVFLTNSSLPGGAVPNGPRCLESATVNGTLYFLSPTNNALGGYGGWTIFRTDGTTVWPVADATPGIPRDDSVRMQKLTNHRGFTRLVAASQSTLVVSDGTTEGTRQVYSSTINTPFDGQFPAAFVADRIVIFRHNSSIVTIRHDGTDLRTVTSSVTPRSNRVSTRERHFFWTGFDLASTADGLTIQRVALPAPISSTLAANDAFVYARTATGSLIRSDGTLANTSVIAENVDASGPLIGVDDVFIFASRSTPAGPLQLMADTPSGVQTLGISGFSSFGGDGSFSRVLRNDQDIRLLIAARGISSTRDDLLSIDIPQRTVIRLTTRTSGESVIADAHEPRAGVFLFSANNPGDISAFYTLDTNGNQLQRIGAFGTGRGGTQEGKFVGLAGEVIVVPANLANQGFEPYGLRIDGIRTALGDLVSDEIAAINPERLVPYRDGVVALISGGLHYVSLAPTATTRLELPFNTGRFDGKLLTTSPGPLGDLLVASVVPSSAASSRLVVWTSPTSTPQLTAPYFDFGADRTFGRERIVFSGKDSSRSRQNLYGFSPSTLTTELLLPLDGPGNFGPFVAEREGETRTLIGAVDASGSRSWFINTDGTAGNTSPVQRLANPEDSAFAAIKLRTGDATSATGFITLNRKILRRNGSSVAPDAGVDLNAVTSFRSATRGFAFSPDGTPDNIEQFWFTALEQNQPVLASSDFTVDGTMKRVNLRGTVQELVTMRSSQGKRIVLVLDNPTTGAELWISDGTQQGTRPLGNFRDTGASFARHLTSFGDFVLFTANDSLHGREVWMTRGTDASTRMVVDLEPGPIGMGFQFGVALESTAQIGFHFTRVGDQVIFPAYTREHGFELLAVGIPSACDSIDFNRDGIFPSDEDLVDFLSVLAGGACSTGSCGDLDFNNDDIAPSDDDVLALLRVLAGGACE